MLRVLSVQGQVPIALGKCIFNHGARETQTFVFAVDGANRLAGLNTMLVGVSETHFFKDAKYGGINLLDIGFREGFVLPS